jgi:hypothetical protein
MNLSGYLLWLYIAIGFVILIFIKQYYHDKTNKPDTTDLSTYPYRKKNYLLTKSEKSFFEVMKLILPPNFYLYPQVHLEKILEVIPVTSNWQSYHNKIDRKSIDFVIFDKNLSPLLAIELDDSSHTEDSRIIRDGFVNKALEEAKIHIIHVPAQYEYNIEKLKEEILSKLEFQH